MASGCALHHGLRGGEGHSGCTRISRLAAERMVLHRGHQAADHHGRYAAGPRTFRRGHPARLKLCPGLLRAGIQRDVCFARRGRRIGRTRLPARYGQQVVPPVLRPDACLRRTVRPGRSRLPQPDRPLPQGAGLLPDSRGALRADPPACRGRGPARLGRGALRAHPRAEQHEAPPARGHRTDRTGPGRGPAGGGCDPLRTRTPCGAGQPLRRRRTRLAGPRGVRRGAADRLDEPRNAHVAGRLLHLPAGLPLAAGRLAEVVPGRRTPARDEDPPVRTVHLGHPLLPRILPAAQRPGLGAGHQVSRRQTRRGTLCRPPDRLRGAGPGPCALQEPPRRPASRGGVLPHDHRHRELQEADRLGRPLRREGHRTLSQPDRLPTGQGTCGQPLGRLRPGPRGLRRVARIRFDGFAAQRGLGHDRRHVAPEGHRGRHRLGRADGPGDHQAHGRIPQGDETLLQRL